MKPSESNLLLKTFTAAYDMADGTYWPFQYNSRMPLFQPAWIPRMLHDQRIQFGLKMIKGPLLSAARFYVKDEGMNDEDGEPSELKKFLIKNIERFWRFSATKALRAIEWGYSGNECLFRLYDNKIYFDSLKILHPRDVKVIIKKGNKVGLAVKRVPGRVGTIYLGGPKALWHIHQREENPWYGLSRLFGAFHPWFEMHTDGGAKDVRKLYYRKYAFSGETMYYPVGDAPLPTDSTDATTLGQSGQYSNKWVAQNIIEKRRTGGTIALPNTRFEDGTKKWELLPATAGPGGVDVLEYHTMMKAEMFEGLGVPSEMADAAEVGSGWSGRKIPAEAFFAMEQEMLNWLIFDFDQQVLRELVLLNYGKAHDYEIIPFGLVKGPGDIEQMEKETNAGVPAAMKTEAHSTKMAIAV